MSVIINSEQVGEKINCFQFISEGSAYIIPSNAIVEILPLTHLESTNDMPNWLYGILLWKDINIPVINLNLDKTKAIEKTKLTRLLLFYSILNQQQTELMPLMGTLIAQIPKSLVIYPQQLQYEKNPSMIDTSSYPVTGKGLQAYIADIEKLSTKVAKYTKLFNY